jgi:hypothetical protein
MGCGSSSAKGGEKAFKPKKGGKCLAPCPMDGDKDRTAVILEVKGKGAETTYTVYFPEYEPTLEIFPRGTGDEDLKKYKAEKVQAIKNLVPGLGKKTTLTENLKADQLKKNPFPAKMDIGTLSPVGLPDLDDIFNPAGAIITTIKKTNNLIYECWKEIFRLENKYDIHFSILLKATAGIIDTENPSSAALDGCDVPFKKEVGLVIVKLLLAAIELVASIPPLVEEMTKLVSDMGEKTKDESEEGGKSTKDKLSDMCEGAGLPPLEKMKAIKNALTNILTLKAMPGAMKALVETGSFTVDCITTACAGTTD